MSPMPQIDFSRLVKTIQEDLSLVSAVFREKGAGHFARPLLVGIILVFGSSQMIYKPAKKKSTRINAQITTAQSVSQYAEDYRAKRDRLAWAYTQLPRIEDRDEWLYKSLVESLKAENIVAQKLPPMIENELGGLITQQANMSATVKFMEAIRWFNRIESGRPLIHVNSVSISKRQGAAIGTTDVNCEIMTIIPKKRLDQ
jgi:hypothetical protein